LTAARPPGSWVIHARWRLPWKAWQVPGRWPGITARPHGYWARRTRPGGRRERHCRRPSMATSIGSRPRPGRLWARRPSRASSRSAPTWIPTTPSAGSVLPPVGPRAAAERVVHLTHVLDRHSAAWWRWSSVRLRPAVSSPRSTAATTLSVTAWTTPGRGCAVVDHTTRQGPGKVTIRPHLSDCPGPESDSSDRHARALVQTRLAGALDVAVGQPKRSTSPGGPGRSWKTRCPPSGRDCP
jgi:hypothetical protein